MAGRGDGGVQGRKGVSICLTLALLPLDVRTFQLNLSCTNYHMKVLLEKSSGTAQQGIFPLSKSKKAQSQV